VPSGLGGGQIGVADVLSAAENALEKTLVPVPWVTLVERFWRNGGGAVWARTTSQISLPASAAGHVFST
jgi:hypothetical protein